MGRKSKQKQILKQAPGRKDLSYSLISVVVLGTALIREVAEVRKLMKILSGIDVRPLAPEQEIELSFRQGKPAAEAVEFRFREISSRGIQSVANQRRIPAGG